MEQEWNITPHSLRIKPVAIRAYFDRVQVWLRSPVEANFLRELCGHLYVGTKPARFDFNFRQRLELKQPSEMALRWIASRADALVNRVEVSVDYSFASEKERDTAYDYFDQHRVRRWHGRKSLIHVHPGSAETRYDAARRSKNATVQYKQAFSRVTGELHVLHLEWRASGRRAVAAAGINSPGDLLEFNHREFWEKRLLLVEIEAERLGIYLRNSWEGKRGRQAEVSSWRGREINLSRRKGNVILKSADNLQEVLDKYGNWIRFERVMRKLPIENWLPDCGGGEGGNGDVAWYTTRSEGNG